MRKMILMLTLAIVSSVWMMSMSQINSLCDEWNIAKISNAGGPIETIHTVKAVLGSDTVIESQNYVKLIEDNGHILIIRGGKTFTLSGQITDGQPTVNRQSKPR